MPLLSAAQALAARPLVRQVVDWAMTRYGIHRARQLGARPAARVQERTLLRLVRHAQHTLFGRDHDFGAIRSVADYQERVPLRDYEAFWEGYWRPRFPLLQGVTWPDPIPYFALSSGTTSGATKYIPVSRQMLASNTKAALTTVGLFLNAYPHTPLFNGRLFFLGGSTELVDLAPQTPGRILAGDLSGIAALEAHPLMRPYSFPPVELALLKDWNAKMDILAREAARLPITMLSGVPSWMLVLFDRLRAVTGKERICEVWPSLRLVIHGGTCFEPYRDLFRQQIGSDLVRYTEVYPASEGYVACLDPRFDLLRLIPDHDIFFEFIPVEDLGRDRPTRHTVHDLEVGLPYALALSSCAGVWSCVLGDTVTFERRDPPLLRFTGRTRYFLSAFGEHLISEEVEKGIAAASRATGSAVVDFHVGPVFPESPATPGRHRYLVEFAGAVPDLSAFVVALDGWLCRANEDYQAHRQGDLTMLPPEVVVVRRGGFAEWMQARGKLGGQNKVPRMDNSGQITAEMSGFFGAS